MLELTGIRKSFARRTVLRGINLFVGKGEILGLLGPNGSGKTTTLRIAAGYYAADEGDVLVDGAPFGPGTSCDRTRLGYLPERPPLYDALTVRQYLRFIAEAKHLSASASRDSIHEAATMCQIEDVLNQPIVQLSKGYRQRVGLAQMIIGSPDILLLDEPTNGLDPVQILDAREMIRQQARGRALIYSSHIISEVAALCTRVVILFDGRLVEVEQPGSSGERGQCLYLEAQVDDVSTLVQRLTALAGMHSVHPQTPGATTDSDSTKLSVRCHVTEGYDLRPEVAETVTSMGRLFTLRADAPDLEALFIEHIQQARRNLGRSS